LLVIDRSVHGRSCGVRRFDNECRLSLERSLSLDNSLCISSLALLQFATLSLIARLRTLFPYSLAQYQSTGKPDFTCSPINQTTPHPIWHFPSFLPLHLPYPHHQSCTTTITPTRARKSCNAAFLERKKKDLSWSRLAQHRHQSSPRAKGDSLTQGTAAKHAVKKGNFPRHNTSLVNSQLLPTLPLSNSSSGVNRLVVLLVSSRLGPGEKVARHVKLVAKASVAAVDFAKSLVQKNRNTDSVGTADLTVTPAKRSERASMHHVRGGAP
jgi:hypothetical protein